MDQEEIRILKGKYRTQDKLLRPAVARVKKLADSIQEMFRAISDNSKIEADVIVYGRCRTEVEGHPKPLFTLFGDHKDDHQIDVPGIMQQVQEQLGTLMPPSHQIVPDGQYVPGMVTKEIAEKFGTPASPEAIKAIENDIPFEGTNVPAIPIEEMEPQRVGALGGQTLPHGFPPRGFTVTRIKPPKMKHVHKLEASIGIGVNHRGLQVIRIHDVKLLTDELVAEIEKAVIDRLGSGDGFLDEFCLEFNGCYGVGPKLSEEEEYIRKQMKRHKKEMDDEEGWRGKGDDE